MTRPKGIPSDEDRPLSLINCLNEEDAHNIFAFVGGFVDSAGYMKLQGLFTSAVTGNLIAALASIYNTYGVLARIFVVFAFTVGAISISGLLIALKMRHQWSSKTILMTGIAVEIGFLFVAMMSGRYFDSTIEEDHSLGSWQLITVASILGVAMGAQCACVRASFPACPPTTVLTTILVSFSVQAAHGIHYTASMRGWYRHKDHPHIHGLHAINTQALINSTRHLLSFLIGGLLGAVAMETISFWCFSIPIVVLMGFLLDVKVSQRKESSLPSAGTSRIPPDNGDQLRQLEEGVFEGVDTGMVDITCDMSISDHDGYTIPSSSYPTTRNATLENEQSGNDLEMMSYTAFTQSATISLNPTTGPVETLGFFLNDVGEHRPRCEQLSCPERFVCMNDH